MLQRLESLPFDGLISWDVGLSVWKHYQQAVVGNVTPQEGASTEQKKVADSGDGLDSGGPHCGDMDRGLKTDAESDLDGSHSHTSAESGEVDQKPEVKQKFDSNACGSADMEESESDTSLRQTTTPVSGEEKSSKDALTPQSSVSDRATKSHDQAPDSPSSSQDRSCNPTSWEPLSFRVTCTRSGRKHSFSSMEAAGRLGAGVAKYFGWKASMKNYDVEVLLDVRDDLAVIGIALTRESKYRRNIAHFGPTTLRSTIAYGLLRYRSLTVFIYN